MEKTGSQNKTLGFINRLVTNDISKSNDPILNQENRIYKNFTKEIQHLTLHKDIAGILDAERSILKYELSKCGNGIEDKTRISSLNNAITDLDNAKRLLSLVTQTEKYKSSIEVYSEQSIDKKSGIPRDAFHRFIDSHQARLGNKLIHDDNSIEKRIYIKERYSSMNICKKEYMKLQAKSLDIQLPEKSKERER